MYTQVILIFSHKIIQKKLLKIQKYDLINNFYAFISVSVSTDILPTKGKFNDITNSIDNNNNKKSTVHLKMHPKSYGENAKQYCKQEHKWDQSQ